jgi:HK97 family phage major capsid protein
MIDLLRNKMVLPGMGMQMLSGLVGNIAIPKVTGGATAFWVSESGAPTASDQAFGQVAMSPKTLAAQTAISRKLLLQSSIDVEGFVQNDLARVLAQEIQRVAINGTGTNPQPRGILNTVGIGNVAGGTNGATPTWANIVQLETEVAQDNADIGGLAYITNAKVRGKLKATMRTATYGDIPIWADGAQPLNGYPAYVTNQVSSGLTKNSSGAVCSAIFFGNWNELLIGLWGGLDILADPYTGSISGTVRIVAFQSMDIGVRHAQSFAAMLDALTT